jgi:hypothetical protein
MIKIDGAIRGILRSLKKRQYIPFREWFTGEAKEKAQCLSGLCGPQDQIVFGGIQVKK